MIDNNFEINRLEDRKNDKLIVEKIMKLIL
jgi:hypothetical protein